MKDPNIDFRTLKSEEILILYKEMDKQIKNDLLEGATWETLKNKIFYLTDLSKELEKRNIPVKPLNDTPASFNFREE